MTAHPRRFPPAEDSPDEDSPDEDSLDAAALAFMAALSAKAAHLRRRREVGGRWTFAKSIAAAALALELCEGCPPETALAAAGRAAAEMHRLGRGALKTRGSEARALLSYGIADAGRLELVAAPPEARLDAIAAMVLRLPLRTAMDRRAEALAGARGGRRPEGAMVAEVKALIRQDQAGDPAARAQLVAVCLHLRPWTDRILQRSVVTP